MRAWIRTGWVTLFILILLVACQPPGMEKGPDPAREEPVEKGKATVEKQWVVKWKRDEPDPRFLESVRVLHRSDENDGVTMLVELRKGVKEEGWLERWSAHEQIEFIHPNQTYKVEQRDLADARTQDRYYLERIRAADAWEAMDWPVQSRVIVAVVDTGVEMNHPSLKPYLVPGVNLRDPTQPPQDYMGHGTHVAGVIAEVWNGWKRGADPGGSARIMPVKVMSDGKDGDVYFTAEGIREAVRRHADIVVLAQGSWTYSETMADAVRYAEEEGVLVVAATGNASIDQNQDIVYNYPIYYPAAFPEVLGVGSVGRDGKVVSTSNGGPGIDVVAPGEAIVAAVPGGGEKADSGTSFAAPQVAALAALIKGQDPTIKPRDIRTLIRQSAQSGGEDRWNEWEGYGEIDVLAALTQKVKPDMFEPNDFFEEAMPMSRDQRLEAVLSGSQDTDCFRIMTPYEGVLTLRVTGKKEGMRSVTLRGSGPGEEPVEYEGEELTEIHVNVDQYEWTFCLSIRDDRDWAYSLSNEFRLQPDEYENNDQRWSAFKVNVAPGFSSFQGTFHKERDYDWFRLDFNEPGTLRLRVDSWTPRGDPVLYLQESGSWKGIKVDEESEGRPEEVELDVETGSLFVRVSDYGLNAIADPYLLMVEFQPETRDEYEPNDTSRQATPLPSEKEIRGRLAGGSDLDWFTFVLDETEQVRFHFTLDEGASRSVTVALYDQDLRAREMLVLDPENPEGKMTASLAPNRYFLRFSGEGEEERGYRFRRVE
ncbi:S8 family peptidase [Desmospora profundinema]|uniref:Peptidase S8/S53 domain-containing protein n=1 Tax=Desmospora profundinema TaxID=1571184 RepID=A0ABU1ILX3_9BACL|nr:S8 family serine peptidase [Desmospora profundinema]MDR6225562.1 hypothetical protein [Desmospora profundinema]